VGIFQTTLMVRNEVGLHARPAAMFVETSNRYQCDIQVSNDKGEEVNGKSILGILSLDATYGRSITIRTEGEDAQEAMASILALFDANFDSQG
jgi:phosphocarrier protein HPr